MVFGHNKQDKQKREMMISHQKEAEKTSRNDSVWKAACKGICKSSDWALHGSAVSLLLTEKKETSEHSKKSGNTICPVLTERII